MTGSAPLKSLLRTSFTLCLLCMSIILLFRVSPLLTSEKITSVDDFVEYWSAGRLNLRCANPYSPQELLPLQLQAGTRQPVADMMWNPPWTLAFVMPFGAIGYPFSRLVWFICQIALVLFCASFVWQFYGGPPGRTWTAWLIAFSFIPVLSLLQKGQISAFMLLGAVLFLMWTERKSWWLVSLSMLLISVKPHILYLLPLAFLFWSLSNRRWGPLVASAAGILLATDVALLFNPAVFQEYFYAIGHYPPSQWATPTLGGTLRYFLGCNRIWLQFLPTCLGVTWFCFYWFRKRRAWNWSEQVPILITISVLTASYGWSWDYVVMIPVILYVAVRMFQHGMSRLTLLAVALYLVIQAVALWLDLRPHNDFFSMWLAPSLAVWYFLFIRLHPANQPVAAG